MKCIRCGNDCTYPQRSDRRCPTCKGEFAFEPRAGDPITDAAMKSAIDAVSSMGTVRFLPDHVYFALARRKRSRGYGRTTFYGLGVVGLLVAIANPAAGVVMSIACGGIGTALWPSPKIAFARTHFEAMWKRWLAVHGAPAALIVHSRSAPAGPYRGHVDIPSYSFDRAVVCDRPQTVDLLLANNFHFENNCAVLSADGYPPHAFDLVRQMLANNPRLVVYALHDASHAGCGLAHILASDPTWFRGRARVVEVGLRPAHAKRLKGVWQPATEPPPSVRTGTTPKEHRWLSAYTLELAAIRPEQVIKRLYATIVADATLEPASEYVETASGGDYFVDAVSFGDDASASDGGPDGFG
jgi:hypothetical protein